MEQRKLRRSVTDRRLAGVCGGFANYLGLDSALVRVIYTILTLFSAAFPGVILYIACAFIMPDEREQN